MMMNRWVHLEAWQATARVALARANARADAADARTARRALRRLRRDPAPWVLPIARSVEGLLSGGADAVAALHEAVEVFDAQGMELYAAAARRLLGERLGGEGGRLLVEASNAWMEGQGVVDPVAMTRAVLPG